MDNNGWIKLHRSILDWEWWDEPNTMRIFIYCLLVANHEDTKWRGITIQRGSFITSVANLVEATGLTTQQVRSALNHLKSTNEITIKTTNKNTQITICKYADYQCGDSIEQQTNQQASQQTSNKQITNEQQTNNKQITTNKNIRSKEDIISSSPIVDEDTSDMLSDDALDADEKDGINYQKLIAYWNTTTGGRWGTLLTIDNNRKKRTRARIKKHGKEIFIEAIKKACASDFLNDASWMSYDWLICPNNFDKVITGNYDNKSNNGTSRTEHHNGTGTVTKPTNEGMRTDF